MRPNLRFPLPKDWSHFQTDDDHRQVSFLGGWQPSASLSPLQNDDIVSVRCASLESYAVRKIISCERQRGVISRTQRAALCREAQPYQDFIDAVLFKVAGFTDEESTGLTRRLRAML